MAARWHELVGMQEKGPDHPSGLVGASSIAGGRGNGWKKERCPEIARGGGMVGPGKRMASVLAAAPAEATARG